jgi:hypothetical protein
MTSQSRRDLLKKTLAIGAAAYVAPTLVGQVTTVHAHTLSGNVYRGCSPGYWKQPQHLDNWVGYATGADFDGTFGVNFFNPEITLLQAAGQAGGGTAALGRHAVAALLNTTNAGVAYPYTTAQVLDIVQAGGAYTGLSYTERQSLLEAANQLGCPLN